MIKISRLLTRKKSYVSISAHVSRKQNELFNIKMEPNLAANFLSGHLEPPSSLASRARTEDTHKQTEETSRRQQQINVKKRRRK